MIHDLLVMLLEQDIPINYEENLADQNARNDLSHIILKLQLHLRLESNCT
jgi:hypothetical protein